MAFPFLSLPFEVRRYIYRYLLPYSTLEPRKNDGPIFMPSAEESLVRWYAGLCPAIIYANRQIHAEACEILYHENTFTIYVRHPREARLPMNESRADDDSFVLISWMYRSWPHPRNPKIPLAVLRNHSHLLQICRVQVHLPSTLDLYGTDVYLWRTSFAAHHGLSAWVKKLRASNGELEEEEQVRMDYINQIKGPIDEVALVLRDLPRIKELDIFLKSGPYQVTIIEFLISGLLQLRGIQRAQILDGPMYPTTRDMTKVRVHMMGPRTRKLESQLESASPFKAPEVMPGISQNAQDMLEMLQAMRKRMSVIQKLRSEYSADLGSVDTVLPFLHYMMAD